MNPYGHGKPTIDGIVRFRSMITREIVRDDASDLVEALTMKIMSGKPAQAMSVIIGTGFIMTGIMFFLAGNTENTLSSIIFLIAGTIMTLSSIAIGAASLLSLTGISLQIYDVLYTAMVRHASVVHMISELKEKGENDYEKMLGIAQNEYDKYQDTVVSILNGSLRRNDEDAEKKIKESVSDFDTYVSDLEQMVVLKILLNEMDQYFSSVGIQDMREMLLRNDLSDDDIIFMAENKSDTYSVLNESSLRFLREAVERLDYLESIQEMRTSDLVVPKE